MPAGLRILIVEDEAMIGLLLEDMVSELGHKVAGLACDLSSGLAFARSLPIDLAILDVKLGDNDTSLPIAEALSLRGIPFVFSTGYGNDIPLRGFAVRPTIGKPFGFDDVATAIETAMKGTAGASSR